MSPHPLNVPKGEGPIQFEVAHSPLSVPYRDETLIVSDFK